MVVLIIFPVILQTDINVIMLHYKMTCSKRIWVLFINKLNKNIKKKLGNKSERRIV